MIGASDAYKPCHFLSVMRTFRWVYVNCLNRLRFLAETGTKFKKMHLFEQFTDHNSGRKHEK